MVSTWSPPEGSSPPPALPADVPEGSPAFEEELTGPPGWHPDPWQRHQHRFFDGRLWTEHVADGGIASVDTTPVARLARSRPRPARRAPSTALGGPRVVPETLGTDDGDPAAALRDPILLLDEEPDDHGVRRLLRTDDTLAGTAVVEPASLLSRWARILVTSPTRAASRVTLRDTSGNVVLRLTRPGRRTERTVDVSGPTGPLGKVTAEQVRQGIHGPVRSTDGAVVAQLDQPAAPSAPLTVTDAGGTPLARLTPLWDVPGGRRHLPPGALLLDRRALGSSAAVGSPDGPDPGSTTSAATGSSGDPALGWLLLGAVLAPTLLVPPPVAAR